jgi:hypothetical protein
MIVCIKLKLHHYVFLRGVRNNWMYTLRLKQNEALLTEVVNET